MTQEQALAILKSGKSAFITGPAGSGKTFVLNRYIDWLKSAGAGVAITASTGIAATHLNGITLHSWTGMGVRREISPREMKELTKRSYLRRRFSSVSVLIVDEISMMAGCQLDLADQMFRAFKQIDMPFGGVQVVLCGDFFQLPPVHRRDRQSKNESQTSLDFAREDVYHPSGFAYCSRAWRQLDLKICYLDEQHRQGDAEFLRILNGIRSNAAAGDIRRSLEKRIGAAIEMAVKPAKLYTHNVDVELENNLELRKIGAKEFVYKMELIGPAALAEKLQKGCLAPPVLRLKIGARVMFVKNNFEEGYVNGTLGVVEELDEGRILVRSSGGRMFDVGLSSWHIAEEGKIKAEINQYPLRLAWAITVHKSQGMSLDAAEIDLRQSFETGMGYVALSRVRSLAGLSLAGFNEIALRVNEEVLEFDEKLKKESAGHARELAAKSPSPRFYPAKTGKKSDTAAATKEWLEKGMSPDEIAAIRKLKTATIIDHCEKIKAKFPDFDFSALAGKMPPAQLEKMKIALKKCQNENGQYPLKPAMELLDGAVGYDQLRLVRLLL